MDFPIADLMDERACYDRLLGLLHPGGLRCPGCGAAEGLGVHRRRRDPVLDYQCAGCGRVFNALTGTALHGARRPCRHLLLVLRGLAQGTTTAQLARELGCDHAHLLGLRHRLQGFADEAAAEQLPLTDAHAEADELYQNAGEKRHQAPRPRRPAAAAGQQGPRARHLGRRPAAGGRRGRA
jgi:transposase-like protein